MRMLPWFLVVFAAQAQDFDLLLKGGHVIDPKNGADAVLDVAVKQGKIAQVARSIPTASAKRVADVTGLYVTPGLIDIHVHVSVNDSPNSIGVPPDAFSFRSGVTTMVDAGSAGAGNFNDFRANTLIKAKTRVLAFLNICSAGMDRDKEDDPKLLLADLAARIAKANPEWIVGFKSAHYRGPGWESVDAAVKAGEATGLPVMVDFGRTTEDRNINKLLREKLRPGDIYTHCYAGHRAEVLANGELNPSMRAGRERGIFFDIGHGSGSFYWYVAEAAYTAKFRPDSISTDLHNGSMNDGMKDMVTTMSKLLNLGSPLAEVVRMSTVAPAREIQRPRLGNLDVGADADIAVLRLDHGTYGLSDSAGARRMGNQVLVCEMTMRAGRVVWDLNGRAAQDWTRFPYDKSVWKQ
jgi:dihydroorotase